MNAAGWIPAAVVQPDGKIILSGNFTLQGNRTTVQGLARLNPDGSIDLSFAPPSAAQNSTALALALQSDGKLLWAGEGLKRLDPDGSLDASFKGEFTDVVRSVFVLPNE